jgi:hypothetical protein
MSAAEDIDQMILAEPRLAAITIDSVAAAVRDFPLPLHESIEWLTRAIQGALLASLSSEEEGSQRQSNSDTQKELALLSQKARTLWAAVFQRSNGADRAIFDHAYSISPDHCLAFSEAVAHVDWLADFLLDAAKAQEPQRPKWRAAAEREDRIRRAQFLSPVFERAFSAMATINTWDIDARPKHRASSYGHWADFYQRIASMAFGDHAPLDLEGVLDEARRRQKSHRVTFEPGVLPE